MRLSKLSGQQLRLKLGQNAEALRTLPREWTALRRMNPGPPILVTGPHRSGTSWVGRMLTVPGVWHVHEPFNPNQGLWQESYSYCRSDLPRPDVDRIVEGLSRGRFRHTVRFPERMNHAALRFLPIQVNRLLIKDPLASLMSEYLTRQHGMRTVVVLRHPAGSVASARRLQWPSSHLLKSFLGSEELLDDWLYPFEKQIRSASETEDLRCSAVAFACIHKVLAGFVGRNEEMTTVLFEDLCATPLERFECLMQELSLPYSEATRAMHRRFSTDTRQKHDYRTHELERQSSEMAWRWRKELDTTEVKSIRRVWEQFEIPFYSSPRQWQ